MTDSTEFSTEPRTALARSAHARALVGVRRARAIGLGVLLLASAACRVQPIRGSQLSESAVTLDLPLVHQDALHACGLASISALCQYWGITIPDEERAALARMAEEKEGLSGGELCAELEGLGMEVYLFHGTLDRSPTGLYRHVDAGRPPLVMLAPGGAGSAGHHYCLVLGYDEARGNLILLDPVRGEVLTPVAVFDRNWEQCERFTLLACLEEASQAAPDSTLTTDSLGATNP